MNIKKKSFISKATAVVLALAMVIGFCPIQSAHAADPEPYKAILLGEDLINLKIENYDRWYGQFVYYGTYHNANGDELPAKYRVLHNEGGKALLDSDQILYYDTWRSADGEGLTSEYSKTAINAYLKEGKDKDGNSFFSDMEMEAVEDTKLEGSDYYRVNHTDTVDDDGTVYHYSVNGNSEGDYKDDAVQSAKCFLLSARELKDYYYDIWGNLLSRVKYISAPGYEGPQCWWLRSAFKKDGDEEDKYYGFVYYDTGVLSKNLIESEDDGSPVESGVSPAFYLNLDSLVLVSAATNGKVSDEGSGELTEIGINMPYNIVDGTFHMDWKLTLENGHDSFNANICEAEYNEGDKTVTVPYTGATPGDNEWISALIADQNGALKSYGRIQNVTSTSGKATIILGDKLSSTDKLYIFNEQYNGEKKTDFSSGLIEVPIPPTGHKYGSWKKLDANQHQRVCEVDSGHVQKANHEWDSGKVTRKPTTDKEGVRTFTCSVCGATKTESIPKLKPSGTLMAKMTAKGSTGLELTWNKINGAKGYDVFFVKCSKESPKKVKTIKGNQTFKWTKKGLKKHTAYKAVVKAYVMKDGKKKYVKTSPMVHAYTSGGTKTRTNAKSVTVKKTSVTLKAGKTYKITASVTKLQKGKKLMPKSHAPKLRYRSSNSKIAAVSSSGKITAKAKGSCKVYVYAVNGVRKTVKVTVK